MKQYGYFSAIIYSFFSRALYRDVVKNWGAGVLLYLLLVLFISWAVTVLAVQPFVNHHKNILMDNLIPQVPKITIQNGEASTPENRPYVIINPQNKNTVAVIDTSGKYKTLQQANSEVLITKTEVIYNDNNNIIKIETLPSKLQLEIKPGTLNRLIENIANLAWLLLLPLLFIYRFLQAVIYAIFGRFFAVLTGIHLHYTEIFRLSIVAVTPAILLSTFWNAINFTFHFQLFFYFALTMCYLVFGIGSNKNNP